MRNYAVLALVCVAYNMMEAKTIDDYCWRDYEGIIPPDALVSGTSQDGRPLFIGQVLFDGKLIPGKIQSNDVKIYFEYFNIEYSSSANVKILCSRHLNKMEWFPTNSKDALKAASERVLVKGGFEPNCATYLGRIRKNGEINVGKVICCQGVDSCYGLYTTSNGTGQIDSTFDILTYNENAPVAATIESKVNVISAKKDDGCKKITISLYH